MRCPEKYPQGLVAFSHLGLLDRLAVAVAEAAVPATATGEQDAAVGDEAHKEGGVRLRSADGDVRDGNAAQAVDGAGRAAVVRQVGPLCSKVKAAYAFMEDVSGSKLQWREICCHELS